MYINHSSFKEVEWLY